MSFLRQRGVRIALDVGLLVGFGAEFVTREGPDYGLHSWIGVVLMPVVGAHLLSSRRWIASTFRRRSAHPDWQLARFNAVLLVVATVCIASGFPIWLEWSESAAWSTLHTVTGFVSILLALAHLWLNRQRLATLLRRRTTATAS